MSVEKQLQELARRLHRLPEPDEPPPTTLQILGRNHQEQDWQRLLFYFLSPGERHRLEHNLLNDLLSSLSTRDNLDYTYSQLNLQDIQVETEVVASNETRPDGIIWLPGAWFICWELKLWASETHKQTEAYVDASSFPAIGLSKDEIPEDNRHYIYLAPERSPSPESSKFGHVSWNWIASELQASLAKSQGAYPARTAAQLNDFIGTIRQELTMTENQATQREKAQLYVDYHDEIQTIQDAFDQQWERFADDWGRRLAQKLDTGDIIDIPNLSDNHVAIDLNADTSESMRWIFRQGSSWASIAREQWRRRTDDHAVIHSSRDDDDYAQVMLYHRLEKDRQQAIQDRVLELTLWHGTSSDEAFWNMVNNRLDGQIETQGYTLAPSVSLTGRSGSILSATYSIPVDEHDDFFDAYTAALRNAFVDFAVENNQLSALITDAFEHSLKEYH